MRRNGTVDKTENRVFFDGRFQIFGAKWDGDAKCRFSIRLPDFGITLYGLRLLYNSKNNEPFISFPAFKGRDGDYINHYYVAFSDNVKAQIVEVLEEM